MIYEQTPAWKQQQTKKTYNEYAAEHVAEIKKAQKPEPFNYKKWKSANEVGMG